MEHHSSYSAPRSSRGSEHTRPGASVQVRDAAAVQRKAAVSDIFYYVTYFHF